MVLSAAQQAALKTDIQSRANLNAPVAARDWVTVAAFYNTTASPTVNVWKPAMTVKELNSAIDWPTFVAIPTQRQVSYQCMIPTGSVDATDSQVRGGFSSIFGAGSASLTAITAIAQRAATYFESLFSVASGAAQVSSCFGQSLQPIDVQRAMGF